MGMTQFLKIDWKEYILIALGSLITALAINVFLVPFKIEPGGVSGIATVIYYLSDKKFPIGLTSLVFNVPLFIAGLKLIGRKFAIKTLFGLIVLSFFIDLSSPYTQYFSKTYLLNHQGLVTIEDYLLYAIFGGLMVGLGLGIVFRSGATTGGSDLLAMIINHLNPNFTVGQILLMIEICILIFATAAFKSFLLGLYAIVVLFIQSKVIDAVIEGVNYAKVAFIISDHSEDIAQRIMADIERGVTALKGVGMYTRNEKNVLLCVVHRGQIPRLKEIVAEIDNKSFIILTDIREVLGEGFKSHY